jgi:hypothetical protein
MKKSGVWRAPRQCCCHCGSQLFEWLRISRPPTHSPQTTTSWCLQPSNHDACIIFTDNPNILYSADYVHIVTAHFHSRFHRQLRPATRCTTLSRGQFPTILILLTKVVRCSPSVSLPTSSYLRLWMHNLQFSRCIEIPCSVSISPKFRAYRRTPTWRR